MIAIACIRHLKCGFEFYQAQVYLIGMMTLRLIAIPALILAVGLLASGATLSTARAQDPGGDELIFVPPSGWTPAHQRGTDDGYEITYVPDGETAADWTKAARAQIFYNLSESKPDLTSADFVENLRRYYEQSCQNVEASPVSSWDDHGYQAAVVMIVCDRQRGETLGSVSMIKVMRGGASMFTLDRSWRGPAFEAGTMPVPQETLDQWSEFLARSFLCNRDNPETPCPAAPSE